MTQSKLHCGSASLKIRFTEFEGRILTQNFKKFPEI